MTGGRISHQCIVQGQTINIQPRTLSQLLFQHGAALKQPDHHHEHDERRPFDREQKTFQQQVRLQDSAVQIEHQRQLGFGRHIDLLYHPNPPIRLEDGPFITSLREPQTEPRRPDRGLPEDAQ